MSRVLTYLTLGTLFGWTLSRSGATDYDFIQQMFLLERFQLYGIIGSAVAFSAPALWVVRRYGKMVTGEPLTPFLNPPAHRGNVVGGALFGVGWSVTGMCPGPILVNIGEGKVYAFAALAGALVGASAFGMIYPRIQAPWRLPKLPLDGSEPGAKASLR